MNILESISSYNFIKIDGYFYFSNLFYNALFKVEIGTGQATFLGSFEGERTSDTNIHFEIVQEDGRIYFFPRLGRHMHIYNLSDKTMQIIEVRKDSDPFFEVAEVFLDDNFIYFFPKQKAVPTKKMERNTYKIMDVSSMHIIRGKRISEGKKTIPVDIINKYKIKYGEMVSCKQMSDGKWYGFKPIGRDLLSFTDGINHLDTVALTVVNEAELKKYLYEVKQKLFQSKKMFYEFEGFKLGEFLEVVKISDE